MKRLALWLWLPAALLVGVWLAVPREAQAQVLNTLTRAALQVGNFTTSGIWNFGSGVSVTAGQKVNLEGSAGDTYLTRDPDTGCVQEYQDGALAWQFCTGYVVPPPCVATRPRPLGGYCRDIDPTTYDARVLMQTGKGLIDVATGKIVIR
jgi:hypothetical protein